MRLGSAAGCCLLGLLNVAGVAAQEPTASWKPRYTSLGAFCSKGLKGNDGDCGWLRKHTVPAAERLDVHHGVRGHAPVQQALPGGRRG